jgi:hypothetical protein
MRVVQLRGAGLALALALTLIAAAGGAGGLPQADAAAARRLLEAPRVDKAKVGRAGVGRGRVPAATATRDHPTAREASCGGGACRAVHS